MLGTAGQRRVVAAATTATAIVSAASTTALDNGSSNGPGILRVPPCMYLQFLSRLRILIPH